MEERKPLAPRGNLSKLPVPGFRSKRARSPDEGETEVSSKKSRTSPDDDQITTDVRHSTRSSSFVAPKKPAPNNKMAKSVSSSNMVKKGNVGPGNKIMGTVQVPRNTKPQSRMLSSTVAAKPKQSILAEQKKAGLNNSALNSTVTSTGAPKKRPAWDLKGRIQDMEAHIQQQTKDKSSLMSEFGKCSDRIGFLESLNKQLSGHVAEKEVASFSALQEAENLKNNLRQLEDDFNKDRKTLQQKIEDLEFQLASVERHKITLEGELTAAVKEVSVLKVTISELTALQAALQSELEHTKNKLRSALNDLTEKNKTIDELTEVLRQRDASIEAFEKRERDHETERRRLHNTIQELKGNIRVFCRVRPLLGEEQLGNGGVISHMNFPDLDMKILELEKFPDVSINESVLNSTKISKSVSKYEFSFDKVFPPEASQAEVFEEISQLVQSALDGYNVCIFAYGQTGSGKTFTMEGSLNDESTLGMIPRTVQQIFQITADLKRKGWQYMFQVSMLEIYNETIRDLLSKGREEKLEIKLQGKGESEVYVPNLTIIDVQSEDKVLQLLKTASKNRAVAETKCNDRSSRSHSVFQMRLVASNSITGESCKGMLNLIDLAGSERIKESGSEGQRLVEAQSINKSLSNLGNVIMALAKKEKHIPYRNSKLTYLLQNSLGGNSKTLMFVNISPKEECFTETVNSLRFATKVNQCNIGTAQKKK